MEEIKCYICGQTFKSKGGLTTHIKKAKSIEHVQYYNHIKRLQESYKDSTEYKEIGCKIDKCYLCNEEHCDRYALCCREEKKIYEKVRKNFEKEEKRKQRLEVHANEEKRKRELKDDRNSPKNLLKEFYRNLQNAFCPNYPMEIKKIKNMLNYGVTPDCIRDAFNIMQSRGERNLKFFGRYVITEAVKLKEYEKDLTVEGTLPYYINKYYKETNTEVSLTLLAKDVERLISVKNEYTLDNEKIAFIIDYMIKNSVQKFCFLNNIVPQALREYNLTSDRQKEEKKKNDDSYYMQSALDDIINGNITVDETMQIYGKYYSDNISFPKKAYNILKSDQYSDKYSAMEWAYKIGFHFNEKTYFVAKQHTYRGTQFTGYEKQKYINWLREQKNKFEA